MTLKFQQGTLLYSLSWEQDDIAHLFHEQFGFLPFVGPLA
jgi:hypothetical protein